MALKFFIIGGHKLDDREGVRAVLSKIKGNIGEIYTCDTNKTSLHIQEWAKDNGIKCTVVKQDRRCWNMNRKVAKAHKGHYQNNALIAYKLVDKEIDFLLTFPGGPRVKEIIRVFRTFNYHTAIGPVSLDCMEDAKKQALTTP